MTKPTKEAAYIAVNRMVSARILHQRLGHPGRRRLIQLKNTADFEVIGIEDLPDLRTAQFVLRPRRLGFNGAQQQPERRSH